MLARSYRAQWIRVLGGEPLMHPRIVDLLKVARQSGVAKRVQVTTNGMLLPRMTEQFWRSVDLVSISQYPGYELSDSDQADCARRANEYGVKLVVNRYSRFREASVWSGNDDAALVRRIFTTCQIAHAWNCHTIDGGYFYRCPQSLFIPALLHDQPWEDRHLDAIHLEDSPAFRAELLEFLNSAEPLASCTHCLGSVGKQSPHQQEARTTVASHDEQATELIDWEYLHRLETNLAATNPSVEWSEDLTSERSLATKLRHRLRAR